MVRRYCWWHHILWPHKTKRNWDATDQWTSSLLASFHGTRIYHTGCWRVTSSANLPSCELCDVMGVNKPFRIGLDMRPKEQHWSQEFSPYKPLPIKIPPLTEELLAYKVRILVNLVALSAIILCIALNYFNVFLAPWLLIWGIFATF